MQTIIRCVLTTLLSTTLASTASAQKFPLTLLANAQASTASGTLSGQLTIQIDRLMDDVYFKQVSDAFKYGGYPKFLPALRQLPPVGSVKLGDKQTPIKYAHARVDGQPGLVLGTDQPLFFLGGTAPNAKPRAGYEMGIIELQLDATGNGHGTIAAAARVRRGNDGGVIVDDYASTPIKLIVKPAP